MDYRIDEMTKLDWEQVSCIYLEGIKTGKATIQTEVPTWENWNNGHVSSCRLVARFGNKVLGWGALSPTSSITLHEKCGFRELGIREKVAKMDNGRWHDVVLMEHRSRIVGIS